jgi:hypothetical protein
MNLNKIRTQSITLIIVVSFVVPGMTNLGVSAEQLSDDQKRELKTIVEEYRKDVSETELSLGFGTQIVGIIVSLAGLASANPKMLGAGVTTYFGGAGITIDGGVRKNCGANDDDRIGNGIIGCSIRKISNFARNTTKSFTDAGAAAEKLRADAATNAK